MRKFARFAYLHLNKSWHTMIEALTRKYLSTLDRMGQPARNWRERNHEYPVLTHREIEIIETNSRYMYQRR